MAPRSMATASGVRFRDVRPKVPGGGWPPLCEVVPKAPLPEADPKAPLREAAR